MIPAVGVALGSSFVFARFRFVDGAVRVDSSAASRPRRVFRRARVDLRTPPVSSAVSVSAAVETAGVAGSGFTARASAMGEARDWLRVLSRSAGCERGALSRFDVLARVLVRLGLASFSWVPDTSGGRDGARSLIGLISSGPGGVGDGWGLNAL